MGPIYHECFIKDMVNPILYLLLAGTYLHSTMVNPGQ